MAQTSEGRGWLALLVLASGLSACVTPGDQVCGEAVCPADFVCEDGVCIDPAVLFPCEDAANLDACTTSGVADGICWGEGDGRKRCVAAGCGNGVVEPAAGEVCDDGNRLDDQACAADCRSDVACGNGVRDYDETCDCGADPDALPATCVAVNSDDDPLATCRADCTAAGCGDGLVVAPEDCEPTLGVGDVTCGDLGFYAGELGCSAACRFDLAACAGTCGDGVVDASESCEVGVALELACADFGFYAGALGCNAVCGYDLTGCIGACGDGVLAPAEGESCEPEPLDVAGRSCLDFGYYRGELGCNASCGFDLAGCEGTCGDELLEGDEDCELVAGGAPLLGDATCGDFGYYGGALGCGGGCRFDLGACAGRCGDDVVDLVEQCDGAPPSFGCGELGALVDRPACSIACSADALSCPGLRPTTTAPTGLLYDYLQVAPDDGSRWGHNNATVIRLDPGNVETSYDLGGVIMDVHVVTSTEVYAVTCDGTVHRWDGATWTELRDGTYPSCSSTASVTTLGPDVFASAEDGEFLLRDGAWLTLDPPGATSVVDAVVCGGKLLLANYQRGVARFDDPGWTEAVLGYGAWGLGCDEATGVVWAVGELDSYQSLARIDVATMAFEWIALPGAFDVASRASAGGPDLVLIPGDYGGADYVWSGRKLGLLSTRHYDTPDTFRAMLPPLGDELVRVLERRGRVRALDSLVITHGATGSFAAGTDALWQVVDTSLFLGGRDVAAVPAGSRVWAHDRSLAWVTSGASVRRCTAGGCEPAITLPATVDSMAVGAGDEAYLAHSTTFRRWDGGSWVVVTTPNGSSGLMRPVIVEPGHVFGLNYAGGVVEYVGGVASDACTTGCNGDLVLAVGGVWPDRMFAVGRTGRIMHRGPTGAWTQVEHDLTEQDLVQVVVAGSRVLVRGTSDTFLQQDELGWMLAGLDGVDVQVTSAAGTSDGAIWLLGQRGLSELRVR
jgi:cysteine-rich repeat protein